MNKIKAVIFDYGNVLVNVEREKICKRLARHSPLSPDEIASKLFGSDLEYDSETGKYDSREFFKRIKERIHGDENWTYNQFRVEYRNGFSFNREGLKAFRIASAKKRTFILSNTNYLHSLWLYEHEELVLLPEQHIFSFKVGVMKPNPKIWQILLKRADLKAEECVYIDDVEAFCQAAEKLGFSTIHYVKGKVNLIEELNKFL